MEFVKRENQILKTLKSLVEKELDFVVVGGYAVSGLGKHRFSVDCDIVVSKVETSKTESTLNSLGFERDFGKSGFDNTYAGEFIRFKKKVSDLPITFDVLSGSLACRTTHASWSFEYVKKFSVQTEISGIEVEVSCKVPERELMIAFKIHSARKTDVRDIIMMMENADLDRVLTHLKRGELEVLEKQFKSISEMLNDEKLVNSLKGVFTMATDVRKQIEGTQKIMAILLKRLR